MRTITKIIIHCSDTSISNDYTFNQMEQDHINRGFSKIGYHYYITKNGTIYNGRNIEEIGAHCQGYNKDSIGICYEGGRFENGELGNTLNWKQFVSIVLILDELKTLFPNIQLFGHRDFNNKKTCPNFEVSKIFPIFA